MEKILFKSWLASLFSIGMFNRETAYSELKHRLLFWKNSIRSKGFLFFFWLLNRLLLVNGAIKKKTKKHTSPDTKSACPRHPG